MDPEEDEMSAREHDSDWWEDRSIPQKVFMGIGFGILGAGIFVGIGWVTMLLWNALMPEIFGLTRITYWQSWGLLILSFIFFKSWGSGDSSGRKDRKRKRHLRQYMSEEGCRDQETSEPESKDTAESGDGPQSPPDPAGDSSE